MYWKNVRIDGFQPWKNVKIRKKSHWKSVFFWQSVFENLVAQELYAHGFTEALQHSSGKDYERHNALSYVMENEEYAIPMAYVFCQENVQIKGKVIYYPIYMITFFEQMQAEESIYKFDLAGLKNSKPK